MKKMIEPLVQEFKSMLKRYQEMEITSEEELKV